MGFGPVLEFLDDKPKEEGHGNYQQPCLPCTPAKKVNQLTYYDKTGKNVADICNPVSKTVKLFVEGSLNRIINLCFLEHLAHLGYISDFEDTHHTMTFHNLCATHHMIRGICSILVEVSGICILHAKRFAG